MMTQNNQTTLVNLTEEVSLIRDTDDIMRFIKSDRLVPINAPNPDVRSILSLLKHVTQTNLNSENRIAPLIPKLHNPTFKYDYKVVESINSDSGSSDYIKISLDDIREAIGNSDLDKLSRKYRDFVKVMIGWVKDGKVDDFSIKDLDYSLRAVISNTSESADHVDSIINICIYSSLDVRASACNYYDICNRLICMINDQIRITPHINGDTSALMITKLYSAYLNGFMEIATAHPRIVFLGCSFIGMAAMNLVGMPIPAMAISAIRSSSTAVITPNDSQSNDNMSLKSVILHLIDYIRSLIK